MPVGEGAMSALIGTEIDGAEAAAREAAAQGGVCVVANDNAPGQVVISGSADDRRPRRRDRQDQGRQARHCAGRVSAPFHCPLMQPAADAMREALAQVTIRPPAVPVLANVTAGGTSEPETIRRLLVEQVRGGCVGARASLALRGSASRPPWRPAATRS